MADSTLAAIIKKVRRLTRSPSVEQITEAEIKEYINTFIQYDFPQELRLFSFRKTFTFYTSAGVDLYTTDATAADPLTNFRNIYNAVYNPIYVDGVQAMLVQSEQELFARYPFVNTIADEATGDGATVAFTGTLAAVPVAKNHVLFAATNVNGVGIRLTDDGAAGATGALEGDGTGTINYETGAYTLTFNTAPANGEKVRSHTVFYSAGRPDTVLFFNNNFTVRPIPDQVYPIQINVDARPTELINSGDVPELEQWWQYIAYGAAKKRFEDQSDAESIQEIMPEFKNQEALVLYRTIVIGQKERSQTIYSDGLWIGYGSRWGRSRYN